MKILVIGNGGREHALCWKIAQSSLVKELFVASGNAGMMLNLPNLTTVNINPTAIFELLSFAKKENIDLTVVGPENSLSAGIVDLFENNGLKIFGPSKEASQLESSKSFAKEVMFKASVPTAQYETFKSFDSAVNFIEQTSWNKMVVKCDGLASGKGVAVCLNKQEAFLAVKGFMVDDVLGFKVENLLIEEYLVGPEVSVFALSDGNDVVFLGSAQDHKRLRDNDQGPNTGGMGVVSPSPVFTDNDQEYVMDSIIRPTICEMKNRGIAFTGVLFAGLMKTSEGYKTLEFNVRFGDPETQALMPLLDEDLVPWLLQSSNKKFKEIRHLKLKPQKSVHVVMASHGYPGTEGIPIRLNDKMSFPTHPEQKIFFAGVKKIENDFFTAGGRVLGVTAIASTYTEARNAAYAQIEQISFAGSQSRSDIGRSL